MTTGEGGESTPDGSERRQDTRPLHLLGTLKVQVVARVGGEHVAFDGIVVQLTDRTVTVDLQTGPEALTVSMAKEAMVVFGAEGAERAAFVRPGRRVDDVHSPTRIELVLEEVTALADLERELEG